MVTMDIYFNYPQGDQSVLQVYQDSTVRDLYDHVEATCSFKSHCYVIDYNNEHLLDMDVYISYVIFDGVEVDVNYMHSDPPYVMSLREMYDTSIIYALEVTHVVLNTVNVILTLRNSLAGPSRVSNI